MQVNLWRHLEGNEGMKSTKIKCRRCDGKGEVELDAVLANELHLLKEFKSATAQDFFNECRDSADVSVTAHNKRLERLRSAGLVTRKENGRGWIYSPK